MHHQHAQVTRLSSVTLPTPLIVIAALALFASACGDDEASTAPTAEIDTFLTVTELVGGDFTVVTAIENCDGTPSARVLADSTILLGVEAIEPVTVLQDSGGANFEATDERARFFVTIPSDRLDPAVYGLPVRTRLTVEVQCESGTAVTDSVAIEYVPTDVTVTPPGRQSRFWASDVPGDLLLCDDTS
ncbi:MAG: hypothetical protein AAF658_22475, partial [Myxococcota bacterium]